MDYEFKVERQDNGEVIVAGKADSQQNAEKAALALKGAFPDAVVQFKTPNDRPTFGGKSYRWTLIVTQSPEALTNI